MWRRAFLIAGALCGLVGVALGAWGAHGLQSYLGHTNTGSWETAVLYQLVHAPVLLAIGLWMRSSAHGTLLKVAGTLIAIGVVLFSGSIYWLTLDTTGLQRSWLGPMTPIGGTSLLVGWAVLCAVAWRQRD